ncbi:Spo0E family sporulation regulatory protein-aspartic acid phosphatase [Peribacillus sp. SCS-155]|uniref:Spo0E family sporulation regulatory protein-aspartic acid phosphatase n=1 Tax=Peribacillus sedimenti TaxID=3115297 RepID=UPI003905C629
MIKSCREQMIELGLKQGFTSPETVELSQRLDYLLNIYHNLETYYTNTTDKSPRIKSLSKKA